MMSCSEFEKLIALHVGGDLGEREAARVEQHLDECAGCRQLAGELAASREALGGLRTEPVDREALAEVRRRVLEQVESSRPAWIHAWRWKYGYALAAAMMLLVLAVRWRQPAAVPPPRLIAPRLHVPEAPVVMASKPVTPGPAAEKRRAPTRVAAGRVEKPAPQQQLVVKLMTDDPDVVILWLIDRKGGS